MTHFLGNGEAERIDVLHQYQILNTPGEQDFDDITNLAATLCGAPISLVSLIDTSRVWFKAAVGLQIKEIPRDHSFCSHAIKHSDVFIVPDTLQDTRFVANPLVTSQSRIRFYAGAPLITPSGCALGTLCVLDRVPRELNIRQISCLQILARQVVAHMELRRKIAGHERELAVRGKIEETVRRNESRFLALSNSAPVGIFETDRRGHCLFTNAQWQQMTGLTLEESVGTDWWNAVHPQDRSDVTTVWEICAEQGHDFYMEFRFIRPKGQVCWVRSHATAICAASGAITSYVGTVADITEYKQYQQQIEEQVMYIQENSLQLEMQKRELEALNAQLKALAVTDGLTGLKNHRAFQEKLAEEAKRSQRYHKPLSLLLLDVDRFKRYNDTFGHPAGDLVLKTVATLLQKTVRTSDFVARYGGEEFVILLPDTEADGATQFAERVRAAIASHPWQNREVTISIGAAALRPHCTPPSVLLEQADQALYISKTGGRNRVTLFGSSANAPNAPAAE